MTDGPPAVLPLEPDRPETIPGFADLTALVDLLEGLHGRTFNVTALIDTQALAEAVHAELLKKASYNARMGLA